MHFAENVQVAADEINSKETSNGNSSKFPEYREENRSSSSLYTKESADSLTSEETLK